MNVFLWIIRWIELDNPVDLGNVKSSSCHIRTQHRSLVALAELKECGGPLDLFLPAMNVHHWDINVVEQLGMELDRIARRKEHHNLFVLVPFQERKQQQEPLIGRTGDISLLQTGCSGLCRFALDFNKDRILLIDGQPNEVLHTLCLCCREQHGLPFLRKDLEDGSQVVFESLFQDPVGFVHYQCQQIPKHESPCVLQVIQ